MGMVIDGMWSETDDMTANGRFERPKSVYDAEFDPHVPEQLWTEPGRFHLIASLSCPWSHSVLLVRRLKGLRQAVPLQIAGEPRIEGYAVAGSGPWLVPGTRAQIRHLHQLYTVADPAYTGRATVPILWDSQTGRIASNESQRILRIFDAAGTGEPGAFTLVPSRLTREIDHLNARLYRDLCNAVYRAGFAQRQTAYERAVTDVFATLDYFEIRLAKERYLFGATITECDWRLFATLVRFDTVYHTLFKCTHRRLIDYPNLWAYARDLYAWRGVAKTVDFDAIRHGYYYNDRGINPFGIVALPPAADWSAPNGRDRFGPARLATIAGHEIAVDTATLHPLDEADNKQVEP